ncbi:hypothetical protein [Aurantiacibacter sediminis]|uniref:DUF2470 domain-containing protein n=1 Tax=Aurantiacibacter sediminis TaxID=2793064 RepID=A0ABS0N3A9_9SPHN|nr:hypothetical protein [Aurantiacibacter sediminis]MBH5322456.1 hypothetical protein [Aurantiacibacter sediminis]
MSGPASRLEEDLFPSARDVMASWGDALSEGGRLDAMAVSEASFDLPVEFQLIDRDGHMELRASSPTQKTHTTILPVWHRLRLTVVAEREEVGDA